MSTAVPVVYITCISDTACVTYVGVCDHHANDHYINHILVPWRITISYNKEGCLVKMLITLVHNSTMATLEPYDVRNPSVLGII